MRSIERRFKNLKERNPSLGDCINFMKAVRGQNFGKDMIGRWFNKLVDKNEYDTSDKKALISQFVDASRKSETTPEDNKF